MENLEQWRDDRAKELEEIQNPKEKKIKLGQIRRSIEYLRSTKRSTENKEDDLVFNFDIRYKHPQSDDLYKERTSSGSDFEHFQKMKAELENPFAELNGKEITLNGETIGKIKINPNIFPQCINSPSGDRLCGWFFQIETEIAAKNANLKDAINSIFEAIGKDKKIDFMEIEERLPMDSENRGWKIIKSINVDLGKSKTEDVED